MAGPGSGLRAPPGPVHTHSPWSSLVPGPSVPQARFSAAHPAHERQESLAAPQPSRLLEGAPGRSTRPGGRGGAGRRGSGWCQAPSSECGGSTGPRRWAVPGPTRTRGGQGSSHLWGTPARGDPVRGTSLQRLHTSPPRESESVGPCAGSQGSFGELGQRIPGAPGTPGRKGHRGTPPHPGRGGRQCRRCAAGPKRACGARPSPWAEAGRWSARVAAGSRVCLWSPR